MVYCMITELLCHLPASAATRDERSSGFEDGVVLGDEGSLEELKSRYPHQELTPSIVSDDLILERNPWNLGILAVHRVVGCLHAPSPRAIIAWQGSGLHELDELIP